MSLSTEYLWPQWPAVSGVRAVCTLRTGGASRGAYAAFNLGAHVGDAPLAVAQNRSLLRQQLALPREPLWLEQVHGSDIVDADRSELQLQPQPQPARGDGAVTRQHGPVLAVLVADCLPVLFAARDGSAVAVAHAGWRGLAAGVLEAAVAAMAGCGPLQAWLGPAIGPAHFEVGEEVRAAFVARERTDAAAFVVNARGRWQCDLQALARARLRALGIDSLHGEPACTYAQPQHFYSYRRDGVTGRMAALIWLQAP
jgi:YfiH family protein